MPDLVAELAERGRSLGLEDRSRLVELLLESLHEPPLSEIEAAWDKEIERRVAAYERGEVETFAAEDVFAEARCIAPRSKHASPSTRGPSCSPRRPTTTRCRRGSGLGSAQRRSLLRNVPLLSRCTESRPQTGGACLSTG